LPASLSSPPTADTLLLAGAARLAEAGIETPRLDAELLLRHVLGWDRARLIAAGATPIDAGSQEGYLQLVAERALRRPLQHLTGLQAFWRHEFLVTADVLVPRPETELLVEAALGVLRGTPSPQIADVGTGSGCIAISLGVERPDALVHATDLSPAALAVAERNAQRIGVGPRVVFHLGDLLAPVRGLTKGLHLVVSNPPYVDEADRAELAPEVRDHEPPLALFAPGEVTSVYRRLVPAAADLLLPAGWLALEVGLGLAARVSRICEDSGLRVERVVNDLRGIPRVVLARKAPALRAAVD
jgi:release factor glutamine methyltransferase